MDIIEFCQFCIDNNLLEFLRQKEYGGTIAEFHVLKDFNIQWKEQQYNYHGSYPIYTMEQGDMFILTELMGTATRKRGLLNLCDEWRKEIDVSTDEKERMTFYDNMKERLSYDRK